MKWSPYQTVPDSVRSRGEAFFGVKAPTPKVEHCRRCDEFIGDEIEFRKRPEYCSPGCKSEMRSLRDRRKRRMPRWNTYGAAYGVADGRAARLPTRWEFAWWSSQTVAESWSSQPVAVPRNAKSNPWRWVRFTMTDNRLTYAYRWREKSRYNETEFTDWRPEEPERTPAGWPHKPEMYMSGDGDHFRPGYSDPVGELVADGEYATSSPEAAERWLAALCPTKLGIPVVKGAPATKSLLGLLADDKMIDRVFGVPGCDVTGTGPVDVFDGLTAAQRAESKAPTKSGRW